MITQQGQLAVNAGDKESYNTLLPNSLGSNPLESAIFQVDTEPSYIKVWGLSGNTRVIIEMALHVNGSTIFEPWRPARVEVAALTTELTTLMMNVPGNYRLRQEGAGFVRAIFSKGSTTHDTGSYYADTLNVVTAVNSVNTVGDSSLTLVAAPTIGDVIISGSVRTDLNAANLIERRAGGLMVDGSQIVPFLLQNVVDTPSIDHTFALGTLSSAARISSAPGNTISIDTNPATQGLFSSGGGAQAVIDTPSVDLTLAGGNLSADARVSPAGGNQLTINVTPGVQGLYVPPPPLSPVTAVLDTFSVDMTLNAGLLSSDVRLNPNPLNLITVDGTGLYANKADSIDVANTSTIIHNYSNSGVLTSNLNIQPHPLQLLQDVGAGLFAYVEPQDSPTILFGGWSPFNGDYTLSWAVRISTDPNNALGVGTDSALFVPSSAAPLISSTADTNSITHTTPLGVLTSNVRISPAANNAIGIIGNPGQEGLYAPASINFIGGVANTPTVSLLVSGITLTANARRDPTADNVTIFNANGIMTPFTDILARMPRSTRVVQGITQFATEPQIEAATGELGGGGGFAVTTQSLNHVVNSRQVDSSARVGVGSVSLPFSASVGFGAGFGATGDYNVFLGTDSGKNNSGTQNVLIGFNNIANESHSKCVVVGAEAGFTGGFNEILTAVGFRAATTGYFATCVGGYAGSSNLVRFAPQSIDIKIAAPHLVETCIGYRSGLSNQNSSPVNVKNRAWSKTAIGAFCGTSADFDQSALIGGTFAQSGRDNFVAVGTNAGAGTEASPGVTVVGDFTSFATPGGKCVSVGLFAGGNAGFRSRTNATGVNDNFITLGGNTNIGAFSGVAAGPSREAGAAAISDRQNKNTAVGAYTYSQIDDLSGIPGFAAETLATFDSSAISITDDWITLSASLVPALIANGMRAGPFNSGGNPLESIAGHRFVALIRTTGLMPEGFLNTANSALSRADQVSRNGNEVHAAFYYDLREPLLLRLAPGQTFVTPGTGTFSLLIPGQAKARLQNTTLVGYGVEPVGSNEVILGNADVVRLRTAGSVVSAGTVSASDARLKTNVEDFVGAEEMIKQLRPVHFDWDGLPDFRRTGMSVEPIDLTIRQQGLIAQEAQEVMPSIVKDVGTGYLAIDYARCTPMLISCVQKLIARVEELEKQLQEKV